MSSRKKIYIKRIISDINEISSSYDPNIHIWYDENNITEIKALIIGPQDTPYEDGFFFFTLKFPESYPFNNPEAKFETINKLIRFNPNLYECGKVCLSILGTWSGPKWSSVQTLHSVLLSIQSLMNDQPILNEPQYDNVGKNDKRSIDYNKYIEFHKYEFAIHDMLNDEEFFPYFNEVIQSYFIKNYDRLIAKLDKLKSMDGQIVKTFLWNRSVELDYVNLIEKYKKLYDKLKVKSFANLKNTSCHQKKMLNTDI